MQAITPPYKNKAVEFIHLPSPKERVRAIAHAGFNTFLLDSKDVYIDLLTDSGTSAMSDEQWAGLMRGDEAYAGSKNFYNFERAVQDVFGYPYVVPTHQGRGAEHLMSRVLVGEKRGCCVPNNLYFTTSRLHQELAGAQWIDVSIPEASDPSSEHPFKGNIDVNALWKTILRMGAERTSFVRIEASLNMAGGQPFSMDNLEAVSNLCRKHEIFLLLDATRVVENAYFVREREAGWRGKSIQEIVRAMCNLTDGCTMSSKKDHFVNIGGFLATRREDVFEKARELVVVYEGLHTYGGMSGRDMEALAIGMRESVGNEELVKHYVGQVAFLWNELNLKGVPLVAPPGAHAIFIDAKRFLNHIPQNKFPAQTLAAEIYVEGGVRAMERGIVSGQHGTEAYDGLELVRLTIPRRVYELAHLMHVVQTVEGVWKRRAEIKGLRMTHEPKNLRFFQARFERL